MGAPVSTPQRVFIAVFHDLLNRSIPVEFRTLLPQHKKYDILGVGQPQRFRDLSAP